MKLNSKELKLDELDRRILVILQKNAKITNALLSQEIGLSPAPTLERVKKLEQSGLIKSYHAELDNEMLGLGVQMFVQVMLKGHNKQNIDLFMDAIRDIPEVIECHHVTGSADLILKIISRDISSYQKFMLEHISEIEVVDNLQSMVILSTLKDSKELPLPH
ncbi:MAG: Lrp/AsnC family transcriptional regulator [Cyclobacteriaceae bacterium]